MIETLGTETDKKGSTLIIKHSEQLAFSPAYTVFIREMANLIDIGNGTPYTSWTDKDCGIIWAEINDEVAGIFCYDKSFINHPIAFLAIQLTAVKEEYRERGIHTVLNKYFEQTAVRLGCSSTRATVNVKNSIRLKTAEKDNLNPLFIVMSKRID